MLQIALFLGIKLFKGAVRTEDVLNADEIFLTSTTREILPVVKIESVEKEVSHFHLTRKLQASFRENCERESYKCLRL